MHTQGPWRVAGSEIWEGPRRITMGRGAYDEKDRKTRDANALLIAAAPALYEALRSVLLALENGGLKKQKQWENYIRAEIAKAEGREP